MLDCVIITITLRALQGFVLLIPGDYQPIRLISSMLLSFFFAIVLINVKPFQQSINTTVAVAANLMLGLAFFMALLLKSHEDFEEILLKQNTPEQVPGTIS